MRRYILFVLVLWVVTVHSAAAQDWKKKSFSAPADEVFRAAEKVVLQHHRVDFKDSDKRIIRFHVGTTAWSWGYNMSLAVEAADNGTSTVRVEIEKSGGPVFSWGSGKKEVRKIFQWMEEELAKKGRSAS